METNYHIPKNCDFRLLNTEKNMHTEVEIQPQFKKSYSVSDYIEHALSIQTFDEFYTLASKIKSDCGFSMIGGGMSHKSVSDHPVAHFFYSCVDWEWPAFYRNNLIATDPMVFYCHHNILPLILETKKSLKCISHLNSKMADAMIEFNIKTFVTIPTHGANTFLSGFRFAVLEDDTTTQSDIKNQLPMLSLLCTYMHEALSHMLKLDDKFGQIKLTYKEIEVLRRVASGLTSWEISDKLHIAENTVLSHMRNIHSKLRVKTRQHAVAKALTLNLI